MDRLSGSAPGGNEVEISVFGAGTGEAVAIHVGGGEWVLVDSCRDPDDGHPAALSYFDRIGVDPSAIALIVASHWHDDHVDGLLECLQAAPSATFGCSVAYTGAEFATVTEAFPEDDRGSGVQELRACFKFIEAQPKLGKVRPTPKRIVEHQNVWIRPPGVPRVESYAPTAQAISRAEQDIVARLLPDAKRRRRLGRIKPNQASVVCMARTAAGDILLGGDLEERGSGGSGWSAVIARVQDPYERADVFKVPHHGSVGADHDGQWSILCVGAPGPISLVTTFAASGLPRDTDVRRIASRSRLTAVCGLGGEAPRLSGLERRAVAENGIKIKRSYGFGHTRLRREAASADEWVVETAGDVALY
jgi:hypothetical protein